MHMNHTGISLHTNAYTLLFFIIPLAYLEVLNSYIYFLPWLTSRGAVQYQVLPFLGVKQGGYCLYVGGQTATFSNFE